MLLLGEGFDKSFLFLGQDRVVPIHADEGHHGSLADCVNVPIWIGVDHWWMTKHVCLGVVAVEGGRAPGGRLCDLILGSGDFLGCGLGCNNDRNCFLWLAFHGLFTQKASQGLGVIN